MITKHIIHKLRTDILTAVKCSYQDTLEKTGATSEVAKNVNCAFCRHTCAGTTCVFYNGESMVNVRDCKLDIPFQANEAEKNW